MNKLSFDSYEIIKYLNSKIYYNQRSIAEELNISLGKVNKLILELNNQGYIDTDNNLTEQSKSLIEMNRVKRAIILAAGIGLRMIPINNNIPKALLKVKGEILIERLIEQLHSSGVDEIYIIVGFMKEEFEYLIDKYKVKLIVNNHYFDKNNLYSLYLAKEFIPNSYIIPSDVYFTDNPFCINELQSWYMIDNRPSKHSDIVLNKKHEIVKTNSVGLKMVGLSYINYNDSEYLIQRLEVLNNDEQFEGCFWEEALFDNKKMIVYGKCCLKNKIFEINTYEDLRNIDSNSSSLENSSVNLIAKIFNTDANCIRNITYLKKGMTNKSFLFDYDNSKYIMRIPGEGTEQLINRVEEYKVYQVIHRYNLSDEVIYMNPKNGYKITKFINNTRVCNISDNDDLKLCMSFLKNFHSLKLTVDHTFDIYEKIKFYELLRGKESLYKDYKKTRDNVLSLKNYIESCDRDWTLTHIDAVPDNFLIYQENNEKKVKLIDWEYAAMQDPHIDIAMFCIYALYDRIQIDQLIDIYFENSCDRNTRIKIYSYIALCGLLWSNWCEYKYSLGIEFGEYSLSQYRYAKDYYRIVEQELKEINNV